MHIFIQVQLQKWHLLTFHGISDGDAHVRECCYRRGKKCRALVYRHRNVLAGQVTLLMTTTNGSPIVIDFDYIRPRHAKDDSRAFPLCSPFDLFLN